MIEQHCHGLKRKLSDGDSQNRCYQRQTIFNISVCKLRKNYCNGEPLLSKTVLIANTIKLIEEDIEEERQLNNTNTTSTSENLATRPNHDNSRGNIFSQRTNECLSKPFDFANFEEELNLLGDKIVRELGLDLNIRNCEKKTRPACRDLTDSNNNEGNERPVESDRETVSCSSLLGLELTDELEFRDVDLSLYDFDPCGAASLRLEVEEICAAWGLTNSFARCGNSFKKERTVSEEELDQVMQILVSS